MRTMRDFRSVEVSGPFTVYIRQGPAHSVEVRADDNLLSYIEIENHNGTLEVHTKKGYSLKPRTNIEVVVTSPQYDDLSVTGSGKIQSQTLISSTRLAADVTGSGDLVLEVDAPDIRTGITGSGNITVKGRAMNLDSDITGSGELRAFELLTENSRIEISGSGDAEVFASKKLDIQVSGSGNVDYKGSPAVTKSIAGSGNIRKAD